jgi:tRNA (cmo5U34)-methyltransferase
MASPEPTRAQQPAPHAPHFPAKPDRFEFDAEVAAVFDDMARRSIPNYLVAHEMHAALAAEHVARVAAATDPAEPPSILDIGASHGEFFHALVRHYRRVGQPFPALDLTATDLSPEMCRRMRAGFGQSPEPAAPRRRRNDPRPDPGHPLHGVKVLQQDLMENEFLQWKGQYDVINAMYVLQFLPEYAQPLVLTKLCTMLRPGGLLSLGQKEALALPFGPTLHDAYIRFRLDNGYTVEEIAAKTRALKGAMWPMTRHRLEAILSDYGMLDLTPVTRSGVFATYVARRPDHGHVPPSVGGGKEA